MNDIDNEKLNKEIENIALEYKLSYQGFRYAINEYFGIKCTCGVKNLSHMPYCEISGLNKDLC